MDRVIEEQDTRIITFAEYTVTFTVAVVTVVCLLRLIGIVG